MHVRFALALAAASLAACGSVASGDRDVTETDARDVSATPDAQRTRDAAVPDSASDAAAIPDAIVRTPPTKIRVASDAVLHATSIHRASGRIFSAVLWSGLRSHEHVSLVSFDGDQRPGTDARIVGDFFYRSGLAPNRLASSAIAVSTSSVAVVFSRSAWQGESWSATTQLAVYSVDDRDQMRVGETMVGAGGLLAGATLQHFAPSITATAEGFLALDMLSDHRLRITRLDRAGAVQMQQSFALPFAVRDASAVASWAARARGEAFVIATNNEAARLLFVDERGITNATAAIAPISRVFSSPFLCAGDGDEFEFAQSDANSSTLWALHVAPERALESVPLDQDRALRMCARPRQWLRTQIVTAMHGGDPDIWDVTMRQARCASELRAPNPLVRRTIDVSRSVAIAFDEQENNIDARAVLLDECLGESAR